MKRWLNMHIIILIWKKATIAWRGQGGLVTKIHQQYLGCWNSCKCTMTLEFLHGLGLISILFVDTKLLIPLWLLPTWYTSTQSENETCLVQICSKHCEMLPGLMSGTSGSAVSHLLCDCDNMYPCQSEHSTEKKCDKILKTDCTTTISVTNVYPSALNNRALVT